MSQSTLAAGSPVAGLRPAMAKVAGEARGEPADDDEIEELGEEIATLAAEIHAATHRLLVMVAEFDRMRGWERSGQRSCAHWLAYRTGMDLHTARERVRVARALEALPRTSEVMSRGELSFSKARAITRVAEPETEDELIELARGTTTAVLERVARAWKKASRKDEAEIERERHESRTFSVFPGDDGMYVVRGRLTPEVGTALMRAVDAAGDALYRERKVPAGTTDRERGEAEREVATARSDRERQREAARRRADAVGLIAERALAAGFGAAEEGESSPTPLNGSRAERYQVVLHVESETLQTAGEPCRSELEDGTRVPAGTSRRLSCDAGLVRVTRGEDGGVLDVGRRTRTVSPALRRALEVRDRGCRFPGCGLRFTDAHHVKHWADGGETSMDNCLLLCRYHHRLVHEEGWRVQWMGRGRPAFINPRGQLHFEGGWTPPERERNARVGDPPEQPDQGEHPDSRDPPDQPDPSDQPDASDPPDVGRKRVAALLGANRRRSVRPDGWTASARWKRECDIPDEVYLRACEAA